MLAETQRELLAMLVAMRCEQEGRMLKFRSGITECAKEARVVGDTIDAVQADVSSGLVAGLSEACHATLANINQALKAIAQGRYGICPCGCEIGISRLKALPFAEFCFHCQTSTESNIEYRKYHRRLVEDKNSHVPA